MVLKYTNLLFDLLPRGLAWPRQKDTNLENLITALAVEPERVDNKVKNMLTESYPLTSNFLLPDWERVTGLPNPCSGTPDTVPLRREAVVQKLSTTGGQSPGYFETVAANLGFEVTVSEYRPFRVGESTVGTPINDEEWAHVWQINAPEETIRDFKVGASSVGDPLRSWGNEILECVISQLKPAHSIVLFAYETP